MGTDHAREGLEVTAVADVLPGDGMGTLMCRLTWPKTPLGPMAD
jgi:hypothetical protein